MQMCSRLGSSLLGLIWTRLLLSAMGLRVMGVCLAFQNVISLGGIGGRPRYGRCDFHTRRPISRPRGSSGLEGISCVGAHGIPVARTRRRRRVSCAFAVAAALAQVQEPVPDTTSPAILLTLVNPVAVALDFMPGPVTGSMTLLFAVGALVIAGVMLSSYLINLNYACGNVTWPVAPAFVLLQAGHRTMAHRPPASVLGAPLPTIATAACQPLALL